MFSPGEAFWNEAILVADGLFDSNDGLSFHVAENDEAIKVDYGTHNSNNVKNGGRVGLLNSALDGVTGTVCDVGAGSAVGSMGMHVKDLNKEVSPFPVKHFDFNLEAKTFDKETPADASDAKPDILTSEQNTLASISQRSSQRYNVTPICPKDQTSGILYDAEGTTFKCINSKRSEEQLNQNSYNVASNTPNRDYNRVVANESKSNRTPASSSIKDCLDLSNWLPLEICHIYNKKGISKLYPWQVPLSTLDKFFRSLSFEIRLWVPCHEIEGMYYCRHVFLLYFYYYNQIKVFSDCHASSLTLWQTLIDMFHQNLVANISVSSSSLCWKVELV